MQYIYTASLDNARDLDAEARSGLTSAEANRLFQAKVHELVQKGLDNEFLDVRLSLLRNRAIVSIEGIRHVVVIKSGEVR